MKTTELEYLNLRNVMPLHTPNKISIPYKFAPLPKNLMEESNKVMEKFLDNYLSEVEDTKNIETLSFVLNQYRNYHYSDDIRISDNFLKRPMQYNSPHTLFGVIASGKVGVALGAEVIFGSANNSATGNQEFIFANSGSIVIDDLYNTGPGQVTTAAGNYRMGIYNDTAGDPDDLGIDGGSHTVPSGFAFVNWDSGFVATQTSVWSAVLYSSASCSIDFHGTNLGRRQNPFTFGPLPDPYAETGTTNAVLTKIKGV